jgi:hypothetical protein
LENRPDSSRYLGHAFEKVICLAPRYFIGLWLLGAGLSKLRDLETVVLLMNSHHVLPDPLLPGVAMLHGLASVTLGVSLIHPRFKRCWKLVLVAVFTFILISLTYLVLAIWENGWYGQCGCFPGLEVTGHLAFPLARDSLLAMLALLVRLQLSSVIAAGRPAQEYRSDLCG